MSFGRTWIIALVLSAWGASVVRAQEPPAADAPTIPQVPEGYQESVPEPPATDIPPPPAPAPQTSVGPRVALPRVADVESEGFRIPSRILTRLHALDRDMMALSMRGDTHVVDGILSMVTGGASIAFGALYANASTSSNAMATYLYIYGAGSIGRGVLQLTVTPTIGDSAIRYGHMPMTSVAEVRARLQFGEDALESLADRSRIARILDASISMATGLAFIPFYLGPRDFKFTEFLDYFVLIGASISIVSGVITLITRSDAERRWSAYSELRDGLREQRLQERSRIRADLTAMPLPGGAAIGVSGTF
ncbi:MAG: hypothetical protein IPK60_03790 [Sandaracinaceae bacterium]|jgi:hypothetical protein|nr:hypothetical protein [Sandaracinaceae bacterium]